MKKPNKGVPVIEVDEIESESERIERETALGIDPNRPGPPLFSRFRPQQKICLVMTRQKEQTPEGGDLEESSESAPLKREYPMKAATFNALKKRAVLSENELRDLARASTLPGKLREMLVSFVVVAGLEDSYTELSDEDFWRSKFRRPGPWPSFRGKEYWPSTNAVSIQEGISKATARRGIRDLVELGVLIPKYPANSYVPGFGLRYTATYVLNLKALSHRKFPPGW
jgi:hypothetical protein